MTHGFDGASIEPVGLYSLYTIDDSFRKYVHDHIGIYIYVHGEVPHETIIVKVLLMTCKYLSRAKLGLTHV